MKEFIDSIFNSLLSPLINISPWFAFTVVLLVWLGGVLWEYKGHRNKQIAGGGLFFLLCFLAFTVSQINAIGNIRWIFALSILGIGWIAIRKFLK